MQDEWKERKPSQEIIEPQPLPGVNAGNHRRPAEDVHHPALQRGWPVWLIYAAAALGLIYVINPTMGIFEFLPDNLPLIGNLDEGVAFLLIWFGLVEYLEGNKDTAGK